MADRHGKAAAKIDAILDVLLAVVRGEFEREVEMDDLDDPDDPLNAIATAVNMVGSELGLRIQETEQTAHALAREKAVLLTTLRSIDQGVLSTDTAGRVRFMNESAEHMTGFPSVEAAGRPISEVVTLVDTEAPSTARNPVKEVLDTGQPAASLGNTVLVARSGKRTSVTSRANPIQEQTKPLSGVVLVLHDETDRERRMQELEDAHRKLRASQAQLVQAAKMTAVGELAGGVAHELNNPLHAVLANAQFLAQDLKKLEALPQELEGFPRFVDRILGSAERCRVIVQGLLAFSRKSGEEKRRLYVKEVVEGALELVAAKVRHQGTKLKTEFQKELTCVGNETQLQQVVINLVTNAAQALDNNGSITVKTESINGEALIHVTDNGPGIPTELQGRIFEPFFTTKEVGKGTGLGLSVSYGIVEDHGGTLSVQSSLTGGTTFTMTVPEKDPGTDTGMPG